MLGAVVRMGDISWFFKVTAPPDEVAPAREAIRDFVKSVQFEGEGAAAKPRWKLPEGWKELPGSAFRYATIQVPPAKEGGQPLEISVSTAGGTVLDNINRWRGQLGLKPITEEELPKESEKFQAGPYEGLFVTLVGKGSGGMGGPMASMAGGGPMPKGPFASSGAASSGITYTAPPEWTPGRMNEFRKAAFNVADGEQKAEITVIDLEPGNSASDLLENVNRWRGQVGLEPQTAADLAKSVKPIEVFGGEGSYVELVGPSDVTAPKTILGVMAPAAGRMWFIKLTGDAKLAAREKERFEAFVRSLKLK